MGIVVRVANSFTASKAPPFQALKGWCRIHMAGEMDARLATRVERSRGALSRIIGGVHQAVVVGFHPSLASAAFSPLRARPMPSTRDAPIIPNASPISNKAGPFSNSWPDKP
jgi:hypothetical protein